MWNSLTGVIIQKNSDSLYLQTGAMEWELSVSGYTLAQLPPVGREARLFTYLHHREDVMKLYGFAREKERQVFLELLKVGGVGPRQTLTILSGISPDGFIRSLDEGDVDALTRLPGLGLKTAQKIILSLRGKLTLSEEKEVTGHEEIIDSLVNMGFERRLAKEAVLRAVSEESEVSEEPEKTGSGGNVPSEQILFRQALIYLSRQG